MPIYCVATLARYVLVEAADETAAREAGMKALRELHAPERREVPSKSERSARPRTTRSNSSAGTMSSLPARRNRKPAGQVRPDAPRSPRRGVFSSRTSDLPLLVRRDTGQRERTWATESG